MQTITPLIQSFRIRGLHGYKDISIDFAGPARVVIAENGAGKTTILSALQAFLEADFERFRNLAFESVECLFTGDSEPLCDLFCTDRYGVENYLVTEEVLEKVLSDEFRCSGENEDRELVLRVFRHVMDQFNEAMTLANQRIFRGVRLGIRGTGIDDAVGKYVQITLRSAEALYSESTLTALVPLDREPPGAECADLDEEFRSLSPPERHRGKYQIAFFLRWLDLLSLDRTSAVPTLFSQRATIKFSSQKLSLGWLAARSRFPTELAAFVQSAASA